jgi:CheY-like chemotaxis protein
MTVPLPLVLCAEDEESDGLILRRAFTKEGIENPLVILQDGQVLLDYLSGTSPYQDRQAHPLPGLVLMALKMPRLSGFDVLAWLAKRVDFAHIPVVILSSSMAEPDMRKARELGVKEFIVKPSGLAEYSSIVRNLYARWLASSAPRQ